VPTAERAVGFAARKALRAGQTLRDGDLMRPELVQRNEPVTIKYEAPGILLTLRGKAMESGAEGDTVHVLNVHSKRTLQGIVTGPGLIHVTTAPLVTGSIGAASPNKSPRPPGSGVE
jgi:flagella basal body P-ring formation protein FlgA